MSKIKPSMLSPPPVVNFLEKPFTEKAKDSRCSKTIGWCMKDKPFKLTRPLSISMSLFGLLFLRCDQRKCLSYFTKVYSIIVVLAMTSLFIKLFYSYADGPFETESFIKVVVQIWIFHSVVNAVVTLKACNCESRFVEFLVKWSGLLTTNRGRSPGDPGSNCTAHEQRTKWKFGLAVGISWLFVVVNFVCLCYLQFQTSSMDFIIAPIAANSSSAVYLKCLMLVIFTYISASWIFALALFSLMSQVIYNEFEIFHRDMKEAIAADETLPTVEYFRCRHQSICQLVETADDVLSGFNAAGIFCSTCEGMLTLFAVVWAPTIRDDPISLATYIFWFVASTCYLVVIAYGGGYLNHMAHAPLKSVHNVKLNQTTMEFSLQMNMFLGKLTGESIGLTALDMFVIDKPTILTISGAFLTYFIVLIQFNQSVCSTSLCDCSGILLNSTLQCSAITT